VASLTDKEVRATWRTSTTMAHPELQALPEDMVGPTRSEAGCRS
jgi:hypothetical protein